MCPGLKKGFFFFLTTKHKVSEAVAATNVGTNRVCFEMCALILFAESLVYQIKGPCVAICCTPCVLLLIQVATRKSPSVEPTSCILYGLPSLSLES